MMNSLHENPMAFPCHFPPQLLSGLTLHLRARFGTKGADATLLQWGDADSPSVKIVLRRAGLHREDLKWDEIIQNYLSFPGPDGTCGVLEASVAIQNHNPKWNRMRVGVPLSRISFKDQHDIVLRFSAARLALFVDGVIMDEDWPVGQIPSSAAPFLVGEDGFDGMIELVNAWPTALDDEAVVRIAGGKEIVAQNELNYLGPENTRAQYWTPRGHNQWVGDVMLADLTGFDPERIHLFYLLDRRHAGSKFNCGGHFIGHMSSRDLIRWEQHPPAVELEPWETMGTGRPVFHDGKIKLFYGMHTSRIMPDGSLLKARLDADGTTVIQKFPERDVYPEGTTFAESADGTAFIKSQLLLHQAQNPSISRMANGDGFLLLAGYNASGTWHSTDLLHWKLIDPNLIPTFSEAPPRNTDECLCMFDWNGWHYIIGGRTGFWMSRHPRGPYWEGKDGKNTGVIKPRWDIYDGLWVPMIAPFKGNRRIMAGFIQGPEFDWAGHLVFRELIQHEDGTLGTKWPAEMIPSVKHWIEPAVLQDGNVTGVTTVTVANKPSSWAQLDDLPASLYFSFQVSTITETSHIAIGFIDHHAAGCAWSLLPGLKRAQWHHYQAHSLPEMIPTQADFFSTDRNFLWALPPSHVLPFGGSNFAITGVEGLDQPVQVEIIVFRDPKSRSTIIDACINGQRTMITRRSGLICETIRLMADGTTRFRNLTLGAL